MNKYTKEISFYLSSLNKNYKKTITIISDTALCIISTWLAFFIRLEQIILLKDINHFSIFLSIIIAIPIFWFFGLYRAVIRYSNITIVVNILICISFYGLLFFLAIGVYGIQGVPRSIGIIQPLLLFFLILSSRIIAKYLIVNNLVIHNKSSNKKNTLIYGAGDAGRQLLSSLENSQEYYVKGFLDDNDQLHGRVLLNKAIFPISSLKKIIRTKNINTVLLALPSAERSQRNRILKKLNEFKLNVKTLPSISEIVDGKITVSDIRDYSVDDLLNREQVQPNLNLLKSNIDLKTVVVIGAGGSIGCELSRQIIKLNPKRLLLLELNEFFLYKIYEELKNYKVKKTIIPLLINAQDQAKLEKIFKIYAVDTVYNSAAYKHVPLVEENISEGVKNNIFSSLAVAKASINQKVSNLVYISSDKAVRPTNIMGATKRLAELCMQGLYNHHRPKNTKFSIVRFGNVLKSSGSVIPKFKKQIKEGGPVTLTHADVTRYFMTVTEAAQLVIQAGAMGEKSEVFVLDMGESIKIKNLIYKMINLSGLTVKDEKNIDGDIEIKIIGLRPGEKLFEELLIGNNPQATNHFKIKKIDEPFVAFEKLEKDLDHLKNMLNSNNVIQIKLFFNKIVNSYNLKSKIVDHIYIQENILKK
jgi:FlaA1/EpsC-like NDP-sugar epimerase